MGQLGMSRKSLKKQLNSSVNEVGHVWTLFAVDLHPSITHALFEGRFARKLYEMEFKKVYVRAIPREV